MGYRDAVTLGVDALLCLQFIELFKTERVTTEEDTEHLPDWPGL